MLPPIGVLFYDLVSQPCTFDIGSIDGIENCGSTDARSSLAVIRCSAASREAYGALHRAALQRTRRVNGRRTGRCSRALAAAMTKAANAAADGTQVASQILTDGGASELLYHQAVHDGCPRHVLSATIRQPATHMQQSDDCESLNKRWLAIEPWSRLLELPGQPEECRLVAVARDELN
jgi:hypothetical protein